MVSIYWILIHTESWAEFSDQGFALHSSTSSIAKASGGEAEGGVGGSGSEEGSESEGGCEYEGGYKYEGG